MESRRELDALAREIRTASADEARQEAEETERAVAHSLRRKRSLSDVARRHHDRGEQVRLDLGGRRLTGFVAHAAGDLLRLRTATGLVDVDLAAPMVLRVVGRGPHGASASALHSFTARLRELELDHAEVELGLRDGALLRGRVATVAADHVVLRDQDGEVVVARCAIATVATT